MSLSLEMFQKIVRNVYLKALVDLGKVFISARPRRRNGTAQSSMGKKLKVQQGQLRKPHGSRMQRKGCGQVQFNLWTRFSAKANLDHYLDPFLKCLTC